MADSVLTPMRVLDVNEEHLFAVTAEAPFEKLDEALGRLIPLLDAARAEAGLQGAHLMVFRYLPAETEGLWRMDVGVQVTPFDWVRPAGEARIVTLPAVRCASIVQWGPTLGIVEAYDVLSEAMKAAGLEGTGEAREWNLHFQGDDSPDTVMLVQQVVREG